MKNRACRYFLLLFASLLVSACAFDGAGHPKPEYDYQAKPGDPEFFLESQFGMRTEFGAKMLATAGYDDCIGLQRVAYMQAMDSYLRRTDLPGPWKIAAPANEPFLIAGQWSMYGSKVFDYRTKEWSEISGSSCRLDGKIIPAPAAGQKYRVRLTGKGNTCDLSVTLLDGTPVETVPVCKHF